jgi:hypothetical protein
MELNVVRRLEGMQLARIDLAEASTELADVGADVQHEVDAKALEDRSHLAAPGEPPVVDPAPVEQGERPAADPFDIPGRRVLDATLDESSDPAHAPILSRRARARARVTRVSQMRQG